ncbi:MAG: protein kinase [Myxococcales bacterium]
MEFEARTREPELISGRYRVQRTLARGGMGEVFQVRDELSGVELALKRLRSDASAGAVSMFQREFHTLATLHHDHALVVFDYGVDAQGPYYTMELLSGADLRGAPPLPWREACRVMREVASALGVLHARRLVHRDISPRNVWKTDQGVIKLIDFGTLASFGIPEDVAGVPALVAPEAFYGQPIDGRSDLYSLGALGYWLLVGEHAYPAASFTALSQLWRKGPGSAATRLAEPAERPWPEIPERLKTLLKALLNVNPMARPASTAEVIDQLAAITEDSHGDPAGLAHAFLESHAFVARGEVLQALREDFEQARRGRGSCSLFEAPAGGGKTRLLREIGLDLRVRGEIVLYVSGAAQEGAYAGAGALSALLLEALPDEAREAAQPYRGTLALASPRLRARLIPATERPIEVEARESRAQIQAALHDWFVAVMQRRPLVLLVDDFDALDEPSAAWLTSLSLEAASLPLMIVAARSSGRAKAATFTAEMFRQRARRCELPALRVEELEQLLTSVFGRVPYLARLAAHLHSLSEGNPGHALELCDVLVQSKVIRYLEGTWVIPHDVSRVLLPATRLELEQRRLDRLGAAERAFGRLLSVHSGGIPLEVCTALSNESGDAFSALEGLTQAGILSGSPLGYRFCNEELRAALWSELEARSARRAHRCFGRVLGGREDPTPLELLVAGVHLMRGGERPRGSEWVVKACKTARGPDAYVTLGPELENAFGEFREAGYESHELIWPLARLTAAGYFVDRRWADRYGDHTLKLLSGCLRLDLMRSLRPWLGAWLSAVIGAAVACAGFWVRRRNPRVPSFVDAMRLLFEAVTQLTGVHAICIDPDGAARCADTLRPLSGLGSRHSANYIYRYCQGLAEVIRDRQHSAHLRHRALLSVLQSTRIRGLDEASQREFLAGGLYACGTLESWRDGAGPAVLAHAAELDALHAQLYATFANRLRTLYYAHRGNFRLAEQCAKKVEEHAIRNGTAWQVETWAPAANIPVYMRTDDLIGMKRTVQELQHLAEEVPSMQLLARRAEGAYLLLRGDHVHALQSLEEQPEEPLSVVGWARSQGCMARACNALGEHARARAICMRALSEMAPEDLEFTAMNLNLPVELALAEAGLGRVEPAARQLEALLERYAPNENPLTLGALHEARAQVALLAGEREAYREHARAMRAWYVPTAQPSLIQRCERLIEEGRDARELAAGALDDSGTVRIALGASVREMLTESRTLAECAGRALSVLVHRAGSEEEGYLFLVEGAELRLVATTKGSEMPAQVELWARGCAQRRGRDVDHPVSENLLPLGKRRYRWLPLVSKHGLVGAAVLAEGGAPLLTLGEDTQDIVCAALQAFRRSEPRKVQG